MYQDKLQVSQGAPNVNNGNIQVLEEPLSELPCNLSVRRTSFTKT